MVDYEVTPFSPYSETPVVYGSEITAPFLTNHAGLEYFYKKGKFTYVSITEKFKNECPNNISKFVDDLLKDPMIQYGISYRRTFFAWVTNKKDPIPYIHDHQEVCDITKQVVVEFLTNLKQDYDFVVEDARLATVVLERLSEIGNVSADLLPVLAEHFCFFKGYTKLENTDILKNFVH